MRDRFSLRARLLAVALALVAAGLVASGLATHHYLNRFLLERVDEDLATARIPATSVIRDAQDDGRGRGRRRPPGDELPIGSIVEIRDAKGAPVSSFAVSSDGLVSATTTLPVDLPTGFSTLRPEGADSDYRVLLAPLVRRGGVVVAGDAQIAVGVPLDDVEETLGRLRWIEIAVGAAVLGSVGLLAWWLVRIGLRPLGRIEETAAAIAAGDLARRVDEAGPRTEIGRLGRSLNEMLAQIERAFAERRASEARLRRFVADASHELRTPLTSVRGYAELFRRGAASRPEDLRLAMERIEAEADRMGVLVDDLLLLARLDQGRPLDRQPVDLVPLVRELGEDARATDPSRPLRVVTDGPVVVEGDPLRLRQIVGNLLTNARVHTPPGTPVEVRVDVADATGVIEVEDEGPGVPPDDRERIFERFYRADASRARSSGGTGLGLSIVASLVDAHGGRIGVGEAPRGGAVFRVELPLAVADPTGEAATPARTAGAGAGSIAVAPADGNGRLG
jgi:two-component system OmpR family sensor kinase